MAQMLLQTVSQRSEDHVLKKKTHINASGDLCVSSPQTERHSDIRYIISSKTYTKTETQGIDTQRPSGKGPWPSG